LVSFKIDLPSLIRRSIAALIASRCAAVSGMALFFVALLAFERVALTRPVAFFFAIVLSP
jgi:hypothetical protein